MKQAQQIGGQMGQMTEEMRKRRVTGTAGGGMVEIEINGMMEALHCRIDPQLAVQKRPRAAGGSGCSGPSIRPSRKASRCMPTRVRDLTGGPALARRVSMKRWPSSPETELDEKPEGPDNEGNDAY